MTLLDVREWLTVLADAQALVPAALVLERLPTGTDPVVPAIASDLDVEEAGKILGRSASTVRQYARQGLLPGAYRQRGREWRVPREAIRSFQTGEADAGPNGPPRDQARACRTAPSLSGWRDDWDRREAFREPLHAHGNRGKQ